MGTKVSEKADPFRQGLGELSPVTLAQSGRALGTSPGSTQAHANSVGAIRDSKNRMIPVAFSPSEPASLGKAPKERNAGQSSGAVDGYAERQRPREYTPEQQPRSSIVGESRVGDPPTQSQWWGTENAPGTPSTGSRIFDSPHESLVPKPLSVGQRGRMGRQKAKEEAAESGWWGALASVIYQPQAEYDPANVV
jgi:hypothetical protein